MQKILIVCGSTTTGKTKLALTLAKEFNGELISADSRQVLKGLNALTGKDLPRKVKIQKSEVKSKYRNRTYQLSFYEINGVKLWMYDVVNVGEEFSVAHYQTLVGEVIKNIANRDKLPILVGGTGLYLKAMTANLSDVNIPPDLELRRMLTSKTVIELEEELSKLNPEKWHDTNDSDRKNPRRLIRAIEISLWRKKHKRKLANKPLRSDALWIGLTAPGAMLKQKISEKIIKRWDVAAREVKKMRSEVNILGVLPIKKYISGQSTKTEAIDSWVSAEFKYAKRQITWFKKQPNINWFDIAEPDFYQNIINLIKNWYTK